MTLLNVLGRHAHENGGHVAVADRTRSLSYARLWEDSLAVASRLTELGAAPGRPVAVIAKNSVDQVLLYIACQQLGAVFAPMNFRLASSEVANLLNSTRPSLTVVQDDLPAPDQASKSLSQVIGGGSARMRGVQPHPSRLDSLNCILFTSGTSGLPKGACLTHANVLASCANVGHYHELGRADVSYIALPLYHTAGLHLQLTAALYAGATAFVSSEAWDPETALDTLRDCGATVAFLLPQQWADVCRRSPGSINLRLPLTGGSPVPAPVLEAMRLKVGRPPAFMMGMTEIGPQLCYCPPEEVHELQGSLGSVTAWYDYKLDEEALAEQGNHQEPVSGAIVGELCVKGPGVFAGYWDGDRAVPRGFDSDGFFHGGDIVALESNRPRIIDRKKDIIRSGGENIFSLEVETVLREHPAISDVAVVGTDHPRWGEAVTAVVVLHESRTLTLEDAQRFCEGKMARYKRPLALHVVDQLPRNATGKVLKRELRRSLSSLDVRSQIQMMRRVSDEIFP